MNFDPNSEKQYPGFVRVQLFSGSPPPLATDPVPAESHLGTLFVSQEMIDRAQRQAAESDLKWEQSAFLKKFSQ